MYKLFQQALNCTESEHERNILFGVLNSITDGFFFLDNKWNICFFNKAAESIANAPANGLLHKNLWDVFPLAKELSFYDKFSTAKETNLPVEFEAFYEPLDLWVEVRAFPTDDGLAVYFKDISTWKKLEIQVQNQQKQQEAIINSSSDLIWSIDNEFKLLTANKSFKENTLKYSGLSIKEGDHILKLMGEEEGLKWKPLYERAFAGENYKHDQTIHFPNHESNYTEITFNPIRDEMTGLVVGVACYARDITLSKRYISLIESKNLKLLDNEHKLEVLTDKLETILNNSVDIIASSNREGFYESMNNACLHLLGYEPQELLGKHFTFFVHPDDLEMTKASSQKIRSGQETTSFRNRVVKKNGEVLHMIWSARWDEKRQLVFSVGRDATALYEAEKLNTESEQRFSALISKGADMIGIIDSTGVYKFVSSNVERILGYKSKDLIGKNAFGLIHEEDVLTISEEFAKALTSREAYISEFRFKDAFGNWRWIEVICTNLTDNEMIQGLIINSRDITERKDHEEKLREVVLYLYKQNKALKEIAFMQSHEVRRPLANILGLIEIITFSNVSPEQRSALKMLRKSGEELDQMIKKIVTTTFEYTSLIDKQTITPV